MAEIHNFNTKVDFQSLLDTYAASKKSQTDMSALQYGMWKLEEMDKVARIAEAEFRKLAD